MYSEHDGEDSHPQQEPEPRERVSLPMWAQAPMPAPEPEPMRPEPEPMRPEPEPEPEPMRPEPESLARASSEPLAHELVSQPETQPEATDLDLQQLKDSYKMAKRRSESDPSNKELADAYKEQRAQAPMRPEPEPEPEPMRPEPESLARASSEPLAHELVSQPETQPEATDLDLQQLKDSYKMAKRRSESDPSNKELAGARVSLRHGRRRSGYIA